MGCNACKREMPCTVPTGQLTTVVVPTPYSEMVVTTVLRAGEQAELEIGPLCSVRYVDAASWKESLQKLFVVEAGNEIRTEVGTLYGLRFRSESVYGDIVVDSTYNNCTKNRIRIQVASRRATPSAWRTAFGLTEFMAVFNAAHARYFNENPQFPPGYP